MSRRRLARLIVAILLSAQLIASVVATAELGWGGLGMSLIYAPALLAVGLSLAVPIAIAGAALGLVGFTLFVLVRWIVRGPSPTDVTQDGR